MATRHSVRVRKLPVCPCCQQASNAASHHPVPHKTQKRARSKSAPKAKAAPKKRKTPSSLSASASAVSVSASAPPASMASAAWEYHLDAAMNGKVAGWYKYEDAARDEVERVYTDWKRDTKNPATVDIDMGKYRYRVDLVQMTQENLSHKNRRIRQIRRIVVHS